MSQCVAPGPDVKYLVRRLSFNPQFAVTASCCPFCSQYAVCSQETARPGPAIKQNAALTFFHGRHPWSSPEQGAATAAAGADTATRRGRNWTDTREWARGHSATWDRHSGKALSRDQSAYTSYGAVHGSALEKWHCQSSHIFSFYPRNSCSFFKLVK